MAHPVVIKRAYVASRSVPVAVNAMGAPATLDETTRSVEVIASTEAPAWVMDWEQLEVVQEVLLMSGCRMPANGQVPLLDSHSRDSVFRVLGSFRDMTITSTQYGTSLVGRAYYSSVKEAEDTFIKVKEGHVTDVSIGYSVEGYIWLKEGETTVIEGKTFTGPLRVATDWALFELSPCPIGADANAKFRSLNKQQNIPAPVAGQKKENSMSKQKNSGKKSTTQKSTGRSGIMGRLRSILVALGLRSAEEDEEQREDIDLVDADGNPISPEDLSEEELVAVVEELEEVLSEAEGELEIFGAEKKRTQRENEEQEENNEENKEDVEEKGKGSRHKNLRGRSLTSRQIAQGERGRITAIRNLARAHNLSFEVEQQFIDEGISITNAKAKVLDMRSNNTSKGPGFHVSTGATDAQKFNAAAQDALLMRCGVQVKNHAAGAEDLRSFSLSEIAREMLSRSFQDVSGNKTQLVGRALSTTDLPTLLVETSRRTLMDAYDAAEETWRIWCGTGIATDFKKSTAVGLEGDVKPKLKPEGGEYKEGILGEVAEEYKIQTFARKMVITREAIINDDLNALTELPRLYGEGAAELVGDVAYDALLATSNLMGDGNNLFHAKHNNLYKGMGGIPTVETLGRVVSGMKLQKDSFGKTKTIIPKFFIAPVNLEVASEQFFNTNLQGSIIGTQAQPLVHNPYGGNFFTRVYDRRLDGVDPSAYYLAAVRGTVTVFFLGGVEAPYIEDQINFDTDGVESKVRMDVGAKAMRWLTMAKATNK